MASCKVPSLHKLPGLLPRQLMLEADSHMSLCYEVHGQSGQNFNFVSDLCVTVNAHYTAVILQPVCKCNICD